MICKRNFAAAGVGAGELECRLPRAKFAGNEQALPPERGSRSA